MESLVRPIGKFDCVVMLLMAKLPWFYVPWTCWPSPGSGKTCYFVHAVSDINGQMIEQVIFVVTELTHLGSTQVYLRLATPTLRGFLQC